MAHSSSCRTDQGFEDRTAVVQEPRDETYNILFSANPRHACQLAPHLTPPSDQQRKNAFSFARTGFHLYTRLDRAWILKPNGELFLWVPEGYRRGLWWPGTTAIMGAHPAELDLSRFKHDDAWVECWDASANTNGRHDEQTSRLGGKHVIADSKNEEDCDERSSLPGAWRAAGTTHQPLEKVQVTRLCGAALLLEYFMALASAT